MYSGAHPFLRILEIFAPIIVSGSMIRFIGREFKDSSPESFDSNFCPARMPDKRRVVVPLFPTSRIFKGADSPCNPFPWTVIVWSVSSILMPIDWKQRIVARQSAPFRKLWISVVPFAIDPNMMHRWEIDLSPGTETVPFNPWIPANSIAFSSCLNYCFFLRLRIRYIGIFSAAQKLWKRRIHHKIRFGVRLLQIRGCG